MKEKPIKASQPAAVVSIAGSDLDDRVWQAWVAKNRERDRMRSARRMTLAKVLVPLAAIAAVVAYFVR